MLPPERPKWPGGFPVQASTPGPRPTAPRRAPGQVVYHWTYVDRAALLWEAREYVLAYEALVAGAQLPPDDIPTPQRHDPWIPNKTQHQFHLVLQPGIF